MISFDFQLQKVDQKNKKVDQILVQKRKKNMRKEETLFYRKKEKKIENRMKKKRKEMDRDRHRERETHKETGKPRKKERKK